MLPAYLKSQNVSLQLSSEQCVGYVLIAQLDRKRVPQARSRGCKSSVAVTAECSQHHASRNVSWPQSAKCCRTRLTRGSSREYSIWIFYLCKPYIPFAIHNHANHRKPAFNRKWRFFCLQHVSDLETMDVISRTKLSQTLEHYNFCRGWKSVELDNFVCMI